MYPPPIPPKGGQGDNTLPVNFFKRRKILKKTSSLDLTPVRISEHEVDEKGVLRILIPKFRNEFLRQLVFRLKKSNTIRVRLDERGKAVWLTIDGQKNISEIVEEIKKIDTPFEDPETSVLKFIEDLYSKGLVTFREIIVGNE